MSDDGTMAAPPAAMNEQKSKLYGTSGQPISSPLKPAEKSTDQLAEFIERQPFTAAMVALIVGYFIGKIT